MSERNPREEPIIQPRLVRLARKRPKLFDVEAREQFLKNLEESMIQRRTPPAVSERLGVNAARSAQEAVEPVIKDTARERMEKANEGLLSRL